MHKLQDLVGRRFGKWEVISFFGKHNKNGKTTEPHWSCKCSCGRTGIICARRLISGRSTNCGCSRFLKGNQSRGWKGFGEVGAGYLSRSKLEDRLKNREFDLTLEYLWELFQKQNGCCALSGVKIELGSKNYKTASIDRIDSSKGHVKGNVQWVHKEINIMKGDMSDEKFLDWANKIANFQRQDEPRYP